jgi:dienelactone hydrolase
VPVVLRAPDRAPWAAALTAAGVDIQSAMTDGVAVLAVGTAADAAVVEAADHADVVALALVDGELSPVARELLDEWPEVPLLTTEHDPSIVATWIAERLTTRATVEEVTFDSDDGWQLHGTRWLPASDRPVPGVVLLHSGRSDRAVFTRLERLLADAGIAVLNIDWRGRGRSTSGGTYFALTPEQRAEGWRDAAAALDHLAAVPAVDGDRLAAVGVVHGAEHAARAAQRDPRVKALVLLTGYRPVSDEETANLTSGAVDVLYVTSTDHTVTTDAMRQLHEATAGGRSRFVEYPGGAIGYQLFEVDHALEPQIVDWLAGVLSA